MLKSFVLVLAALVLFVGGLSFRSVIFPQIQESLPLIQKERRLDRYTIENLSAIETPSGKMMIDGDSFTFEFNPNLDGKTLKKVTGQIKLPEGEGPFPLVIMLRGYVDKEIYRTGVGTTRAAEFFSKNGLITLAPDFLGYGNSDSESEDVMEARFQTYVTTLSLLNSLTEVRGWDKTNLFLWGHSNGGQIALTTLEITAEPIPTTLWAPVSKPFPYSVLYYTDESEDRGKFLRAEIARFEEEYDVDLYSLHRYYDRIKAPLQLHQGTADESVPKRWSDELVNALEKLEVDLKYELYPADHNLQPSWNTVVARDLTFFKKHLR